MSTMIHGVPITADPALTWEEINAIVAELVRTWTWEGRNLGKIELISDGQLVHVCSYEKPDIQFFPLRNKDTKE
ncbi:hypothetical protein [Sporomusa acidovorans]|uniref:Uncharacterized protein n=1 Tax=Sporomusa acidovorans (strain ATCC 49682 / DSM 3132 / Mol) TaxID=1123286 RepID=A0ABZ3IXW4_SPOA4|nr:hypothetical protein [Sporomusa acidovorans]OZC16942.1 hypothetical protein SPACI_39890 [Sporomusa acidovorans DSM 3132]SDE13341.1 hypothetical protein SAMN04488499_1008118 [Sporomusa acidovorans]